MKKYIIFLFVIVFLVSCAVSKSEQKDKVTNAIKLQKTIMEDELFIKILKDLEQSNSINWSENRTQYVSTLELSKFDNKVDWLLNEYKTKGVFSKDSVFLWRKWNPLSNTTAVTSRCKHTTKLNKWKLKRSEYSIANTLIHERVHSFCLIHPNQKRSGNECDPAYIVGDLAQIIILYRKGKLEIAMNKPLCSELKNKINELGLLKIK